MAEVFKHIDPFDDRERFNRFLDALNSSHPTIKEVVQEADSLASSAWGFFVGVYPIESPYFWWGNGMRLPWYEKYWNFKGEVAPKLMRMRNRREAADIASEIHELAGRKSKEPYWQLTYLSSRLCSKKQLTVQGLAVEAMLCADRFVDLLLAGETLESIPWIAAAHKNICEATVQAQLILGIATEKARAAAMVRHQENHAMRKQAIEHYVANQKKYKSLDAAAEAMAGKVVPVKFRTVRVWLTQYRKELQSARKL